MELVGEHLDPERRGGPDGRQGAHEAGEVELALAGQPPVVEGGLDQIGFGRQRAVVELDAEDEVAGDGAQLLER